LRNHQGSIVWRVGAVGSPSNRSRRWRPRVVIGVGLMVASWLGAGCSAFFGEEVPSPSPRADVGEDVRDDLSDVAPDADADADSPLDTDASLDADADHREHPDAVLDAGPCVPVCEAGACGPDGCGGLCAGACPEDQACLVPDGCAVPRAEALVLIPAGTFSMGSPETESGHEVDETLHRVTLTHDFLLMSTEVTRASFIGLMGYDGSHFGALGASSDAPIENLSWHESAVYCNILSQMDNLPLCYDCDPVGPEASCTEHAGWAHLYDCPGYRLPTEAEWECAARAGTETPTYIGGPAVGESCSEGYAGLNEIAWWSGNSGNTIHPVGQLKPNALGLVRDDRQCVRACDERFGDYPAGSVSELVGPLEGNHVLRGGWGVVEGCRNRAAFGVQADPGEYRNGGLVFGVARTTGA